MTLKTVGAALIVLALTACAASRPPAPFVSVMAANRPKPATLAAPAAGALIPGANGVTPSFNNALIAAGYKATPFKGAVYYCRTEDVTNTAFKRKVCLTETEIRDQERKTREMQERMNRYQFAPPCLPFPSCAG